jgi:hypothetical protein
MMRLNEICNKQCAVVPRKKQNFVVQIGLISYVKKKPTISRIVSHYQYFVLKLLKSMLEDSNSLVECNV